jgi:hypothetical protein
MLVGCIENRVVEGQYIPQRIGTGRTIVSIPNRVRDGVLYNMDYPLTISLCGWRRGMQHKERTCHCSHQKRGDCRKNERLLHCFISFE